MARPEKGENGRQLILRIARGLLTWFRNGAAGQMQAKVTPHRAARQMRSASDMRFRRSRSKRSVFVTVDSSR